MDICTFIQSACILKLNVLPVYVAFVIFLEL